MRSAVQDIPEEDLSILSAAISLLQPSRSWFQNAPIGARDNTWSIASGVVRVNEKICHLFPQP
jgi:hypothetical protein